MTFLHAGSRLMQFMCALSLVCAIAACSSGGDGGGGGTTPAAAPLAGVFIDSPVQGLGYLTQPSGLSGVTNANGQFNYNPGDTVTFTLYGRTIGAAVPAGPVVTALSVFNATNLTDPQVMNLVQLLLTLAGGAPAPGSPIVLPANAPANFPVTLDFASAGFDTSFPGLTLVSEATATTHLQNSFKTLSVTIVNSGTVTSNPAGITCTAGTCSAIFTTDTVVTLTATGTGFTGWGGGTGSATCAGPGACSVTLNADSSVTATFPIAPPPATVTILPNVGTGTGSVTCSANGGAFGACASSYPNPTVLVIRATADPGATFTGWTDGTANAASCTGTAVDCALTLTANSVLRANFTLPTMNSVTVSSATANGGGGSVQCSANGGAAGPCGSYPVGSAIVMTATPNSVSNFSGWSGAGCSGTGTCSFALTANTTVTANFNRPTITVRVNGTGSVSSNPAGIDTCSTNCSVPFDKGAVTLTALGSGFSGWSGGGCSGTGTCLVMLNQNTVVTATFGGGGVSNSARYHFFYSSGGPLMAVDPASPASTTATVATAVSNTIPVYSSIWDAVTTSFSSFQPVIQVYASNGSLWRVNVAKASGVPGSASNPPVRISSESAAAQVCTFEVVDDVTNPNTRRVFYELPGADNECGFFGSGGTNTDNITKFVSLSDGVGVAPTVLPIGMSLATDRRFVYDLSSGVATHMFLIDAANSNTVKVMNLSTQAITPILANVADISISVQDTSDRVFLHSIATNTLYIYTVSSNALVPLITGVLSDYGTTSDGTSFFVSNTTAGIIYRIPLTATAAGQVTPILNLGGQIYNLIATTNRIYVTAPGGSGGVRIVSVPKSGGASREDVPAVAGEIIAPLLQTSNGLFYYTKFTPSATFQTVTSSTTVALNESGTPVSTFANSGQTGFMISAPFNLRGTALLRKVLVSTYLSGVFNAGVMNAVDAASGTATTTVGTVPATTTPLSSLTFVGSVDNAALGIGVFSATSNWGVFFMDAATPNSLVQVPVAPGQWFLSQ